ncbi:hypothetical protein DXG01_006526, partial [Tephrocybe rancida]
ALSKTIGSLPPLPPSLDSLDAFLGQLLPPPSSTVPSQAKRPYDDKKSNPSVDLEVEEDIRDDADILDAEADNNFSVHPPLQNVSTYVNSYLDDFINDREVFIDEEELTKTPLLDKAQDDALSDEAPGEVEEDLDDKEERFEDEE